MLHCFDPIRTLSFWAILVRLSLAVVCGGVIGAERETKRRLSLIHISEPTRH